MKLRLEILILLVVTFHLISRMTLKCLT